MKPQHTAYLLDDAPPTQAPTKTLSIREAALTYLGDKPEHEKPVARLIHYGVGALSTDELLACIFGQNGRGHADAQHLLTTFEDLPGLAAATISELQQHPNIGPARAAQIKAAFELGRRLLVAQPHEHPVVRSPADAANMLMPEMGLLDQEELRVILLDTRSRVLAIETLYRGNLNSAAVRVGEVFKGAIRRNAAAILLCHNHPSMDPCPSQDDVQVTRMIVEAGKLLHIDVVDHLILARQRFVSLKERGLGF